MGSRREVACMGQGSHSGAKGKARATRHTQQVVGSNQIHAKQNHAPRIHPWELGL